MLENGNHVNYPKLGNPLLIETKWRTVASGNDGNIWYAAFVILLLLLEWLYSPCGPSPLFQFPDLIHNRQDSLNEWSAHRKAPTETLDGKWPIILLRGPLGAWGSLTCSKFTTRVKQLNVPLGGLVPWIFPSSKFDDLRRVWGGNVTPRLRRPRICNIIYN
jgi:hypothetical protein